MSTNPGMIHNDFILFGCLILLVIFLFYEIYFNKHFKRKKTIPSKVEVYKQTQRHYGIPLPVFEGRPNLTNPILDISSLNRYSPEPVYVYDTILKSKTSNRAPIDDQYLESSPAIQEIKPEEEYIGLPKVVGCELDSPAVLEMSNKFPGVLKADIVRFLVARKGNIEHASEMLKKSLHWFENNLPLKSTPEIIAAMSTMCFFSHGVDREGAPVIYFRGALYDSKIASSATYVNIAAHIINESLKKSKHTSVTVLVHAVSIEGAPNEGTDGNFIKGFVQVNIQFNLIQ